MEKSTTELARLQLVLKLTFGIVLIAAGADKFTNLLANWGQYLHPSVTPLLHYTATDIMKAIGLAEICMGVILLFKPKIGAQIASIWLTIIALNILASGKHLEIAGVAVIVALAAYAVSEISELSDAYRYEQQVSAGVANN